MPRKDHKQVPQTIEKKPSSSAGKRNPNEETPPGNARSKGERRHVAKPSNTKEKFNFKEAESKVMEGKSVFIKRSDIAHLFTIGTLLLGKFISAIDQKLLQLKVPSYFRDALQRKKGLRAQMGAHQKPTLNQNQLVRAFRLAQELTANDIKEIEAFSTSARRSGNCARY